MNSTDHGRILFLDYLRAVACLLVVVGHFVLGINGHLEIAPWVPGVKDLLFGPDAVTRNVLAAPLLYIAIHQGINLGALGVSIFFLISGFVILRAVERESPLQFIIRRIFRIYPVSLVAVLVAAGATAIYCHASGTLSPHSWISVISSGLILNGYLHYFETTPVLWSLEVELFFYLLMAALAVLGYLGYRALLGLGILCLLFTVAATFPWLHDRLPTNASGILTHLSFDTLEVPFLLVGSMLYRMTRDDNFIRGSLYVVLAVAVFLAARYGYLAEHGDSGGVDLKNGAWALGIFVLALWSGMTWRWIRPLKWVADISYPLYLVHVPLAWLCLAWLAGHGFGTLSASAIAGVAVIFVAWLVHVIVEVRAQRWGSSISRVLLPRAGKIGSIAATR